MSDMLYLPTRLSLFGFKLTCFGCNESDSQTRTKTTVNVVLGYSLIWQKVLVHSFAGREVGHVAQRTATERAYLETSKLQGNF